MSGHPLALRGLALVAAITLLAACAAAPAVGQSACAPTRADAEGPFYVPGAPERASTGRGLVIAGAVRSAADCAPVPGARLEWWSVNPGGRYDDDHRATQRVDAEGRYRYETDFPPGYGFRRPHVHVRVTAPGHRALVTQLYPRTGQAALDVDFVVTPD